VRVLAITHQADAGPGVFAEAIHGSGAELDIWMPPGGNRPPLDPRGYDAVLTFGGAVHPDQDDRQPWLAQEIALLAELLEHRKPLLGVCLGAQLVARAAGARVGRAREPEIGWYAVETTAAAAEDPLLGSLAPAFEALEWHSYEFELPPGATALAHSATCPQAFRLGTAAWGIQFHAEVTLTDFETWLDGYRSDEDAVKLRLDPDHLRELTRTRIAAWNELGRGLCERFLGVAAATG
jgi:GMP synthase-like glutamine amidotransferase